MDLKCILLFICIENGMGSQSLQTSALSSVTVGLLIDVIENNPKCRKWIQIHHFVRNFYCSSLTRLVNPIDGINEVRNLVIKNQNICCIISDAYLPTHESSWVLRRWEVAKAFHLLEIRPGYLVRRRLAHLWRGAPVVLSSEEVYGALAHIDLLYAIPGIEAAKVEIEIAVENSC